MDLEAWMKQKWETPAEYRERLKGGDQREAIRVLGKLVIGLYEEPPGSGFQTTRINIDGESFSIEELERLFGIRQTPTGR